MAPKPAAAPATPAAVATGLSGDSASRTTALTTLSTSSFSEADVVAAGIPALLTAALTDPAPAVPLAAAKQLAVYAASKGAAKEAISSQPTAQALWAVCLAYLDAESRAAAAGTAAPGTADGSTPRANAAAGKKGPAGTAAGAAPTADELGPNKMLLESVLRALTSLVAGQGPQQPVAGWLMVQPLEALLLLIAHSSWRVQERAAQLLYLLSRLPDVARSLVGCSRLSAALQLLKPTSPRVQAAGSLLLQRWASQRGPLQAWLCQQPTLVDQLIEVLLSEGPSPSTPPPAAPAKGKAGAGAAAPAGASAGDQQQADQLALQVSAAQLLRQLCSASSGFAQELVHRGALKVLLVLALGPGIIREQEQVAEAAESSGSEFGAWPLPTTASSSPQLQQQVLLAVAALLGHAQVAEAAVLATPCYSQLPSSFLQVLLPPLPPSPPGEQLPGDSNGGSRGVSAKEKPGPAPAAGKSGGKSDKSEAAAAAAAATAAAAAAAAGTAEAAPAPTPVEMQAGVLACLAALTQHTGGATAVLHHWAPPQQEQQQQAATTFLMPTEFSTLGLAPPPQPLEEVVPEHGLLHKVVEQLEATAGAWVGNPASSSSITAAAAGSGAVGQQPPAAKPEAMASWGEAAAMLLLNLLLAAGERGEVAQLELPTAAAAMALSLLAEATSDRLMEDTLRKVLLLLPEAAFRPKPRPPLASPPRTPSPPPLPTSLYLWDALGRPEVTDGAVVSCEV